MTIKVSSYAGAAETVQRMPCIDRTIRVASGDVDWAIKILGYLGIRTYGALVGMRIEVLSAGFNNVDVD